MKFVSRKSAIPPDRSRCCQEEVFQANPGAGTGPADHTDCSSS